ncbi:hypothetical protein [uncultured Zobellia sp.]|uniref:hypothetical protein n=1 Tax=uncultured Zobellia sp. TaxID=255433 RepID=UPI002593F55E|nr:hypothetical protein [uncultured Zobellia sp.]
MKNYAKINLVLLLSISILQFTSCGGSDDSPEVKKEVAEDPMKQQEEEKEEAEEKEEEAPSTEESNKIVDNVIIKGATKVEGMPPTPNKAISMDLTEVDKNAFINEGFDIPVVSDAEVQGLYLQFKAADGGLSDSYLDVDLTTVSGKSAKKTRGLVDYGHRSFNLSAKDTDFTAQVSFTAEIEPQEFCYVVCVYDGAGNISEPQEVCITVNSWGGPVDLVGEWEMTKQVFGEPDENDKVTEIVGEELCEDDSDYCYIIDYLDLTLSADGTYLIERYDRERSKDSTYENGEWWKTTQEGNWSYTNEKELVLVEYSYIEEDKDGVEVDVYEVGDADVYEYNDVTFDLQGLIIKDNEYDGQGNLEYTDSFYFDKK